jgi:hypothetical protein
MPSVKADWSKLNKLNGGQVYNATISDNQRISIRHEHDKKILDKATRVISLGGFVSYSSRYFQRRI